MHTSKEIDQSDACLLKSKYHKIFNFVLLNGRKYFPQTLCNLPLKSEGV